MMEKITLKSLPRTHPLFKQGAIVGPWIGARPQPKSRSATPDSKGGQETFSNTPDENRGKNGGEV